MVRKGQKCGGRRGHLKGKYDIISLLPEEILSHILYFLPVIEDVVEISVLSKRWRYLWTFVPNINIIAPLTRNPEVQCRFIDFVDKVLHLNDVHCLQKFFLAYGKEYDLSRVIHWISVTTLRKVKDIELNFPEKIDTAIELPPMLFTCTTPVVLKLSHEILLEVPKSAYLPRLEILHLVYVNPLHTYCVNNLLGDCVALREFDIEVDPNYAYKMVLCSSGHLH